MLGGILSFFGPSILLSTILRASSNACEGVGSGGVLASPEALLVVNRDDESGLTREVEPVKMVSFGLEDHRAVLGGRTWDTSTGSARTSIIVRQSDTALRPPVQDPREAAGRERRSSNLSYQECCRDVRANGRRERTRAGGLNEIGTPLKKKQVYLCAYQR